MLFKLNTEGRRTLNTGLLWPSANPKYWWHEQKSKLWTGLTELNHFASQTVIEQQVFSPLVAACTHSKLQDFIQIKSLPCSPQKINNRVDVPSIQLCRALSFSCCNATVFQPSHKTVQALIIIFIKWPFSLFAITIHCACSIWSNWKQFCRWRLIFNILTVTCWYRLDFISSFHASPGLIKLHTVSVCDGEDAVLALLITELTVSMALNPDTFTRTLVCVRVPSRCLPAQWVSSFAVIMCTKPHSLHENGLCSTKRSITRLLIWLVHSFQRLSAASIYRPNKGLHCFLLCSSAPFKTLFGSKELMAD